MFLRLTTFKYWTTNKGTNLWQILNILLLTIINFVLSGSSISHNFPFHINNNDFVAKLFVVETISRNTGENVLLAFLPHWWSFLSHRCRNYDVGVFFQCCLEPWITGSLHAVFLWLFGLDSISYDKRIFVEGW